MPYDYRFMPGNIVRCIEDPRFCNLTVLSVQRPTEPGLGGFWLNVGKIDANDGHTFPCLSGIDWQFELDPNREQTDVPYYKITQKRHAPPFYWPNFYVSIDDARKFIHDLAIWPHLEPLRREGTTLLHIVDAHDWVLETYTLVKRLTIQPGDRSYHGIDKALFPYLAHIGDKDEI